MKISPAEKVGSGEGLPINSVAAWLKAARVARGETLDDVAKVTRIGKNYLEALEEGDLAKLPSQAYTRGFIRLYAAHLGLSPETALAMMDAGPADPVADTHETESSPELAGKKLPAYGRRLLLIAAMAAALATAYFLFTMIPTNIPIQNSRIDAPPPQQAPPPANTLPARNPPQPPPSQQPLPQETSEHQGIVLRLKAVSDGKITITIDGSFSQEYDLISGDLVEWKAEDSIRLDLDNAASVEGELDGVKMAPFGEVGKAAHLVVKGDGIHQE